MARRRGTTHAPLYAWRILRAACATVRTSRDGFRAGRSGVHLCTTVSLCCRSTPASDGSQRARRRRGAAEAERGVSCAASGSRVPELRRRGAGGFRRVSGIWRSTSCHALRATKPTGCLLLTARASRPSLYVARSLALTSSHNIDTPRASLHAPSTGALNARSVSPATTARIPTCSQRTRVLRPDVANAQRSS